MQILPFGKKIQLKIEKPTVGVLDTSSKPTGLEYGEVIATGDESRSLMVGDKIFVKAWSVDIITHDSQTYYFVDCDSVGICAKVL